jgi:hypothetical protein
MKINNKYKVDETIFYMRNNAIYRGKIAMIQTWTIYNGTQIKYTLASDTMAGAGDYYEHHLFKTRDDLLKTL